MSNKECIFCGIARGSSPAHEVWSDADHIAFMDKTPIASGHVLLIPRAHTRSVYDLDAEAYGALFERARRLASAVARAVGAPLTGIAVEGFGVEHAHVHLVPVWRGGDLDPCRQSPASNETLQATAEGIRAILLAAAG
jgi:histidine triad (HIT) family protein